MSKEFRLVARIKNNRLMELREKTGLTQKALAEKIGIDANTYSRLECMKPEYKPCFYDKGSGKVTWRPSAIKVADYFYVSPEDIFPDTITEIETTLIEKKFDASEIPALAASVTKKLPGPVEAQESNELKEQVRKVLSLLTPREEEVLRYRFGIDRDQLTLEDVGKELGFSRERIRRCEDKALRKLRHPSLAKKVQVFVDD